MSSMRWTIIVLTAGLVCGCAPKPAPQAPAEPPPPSSEQVSALRQQLKRTDPNAQVGEVRAVMPPNKLVAIDDVPVQEFPVGQAVVIVDGRLDTVARGIVDNVQGRIVVVKYDNVRRDPRKGDLAIRQSERAGQAPETAPPDVGGNVTTLPPNNTATQPSDNNAPAPTTRPTESTAPSGNTGAPAGNTNAPENVAPQTQPANPQTQPANPPAGNTPGDLKPADLKPADLNK